MHIMYSCTECTCLHYIYIGVRSIHMYILCTHMYTCIYCTSVHNGYMMYMCTHHITINVNIHNVCNMYVYIMYYVYCDYICCCDMISLWHYKCTYYTHYVPMHCAQIIEIERNIFYRLCTFYLLVYWVHRVNVQILLTLYIYCDICQ